MPKTVKGPKDLKALSRPELAGPADEIRTFLDRAVTRAGGHLGPTLGVAERSTTLHRLFDSPADRILWDAGHRSHVHKLLTGRQDSSALRSKAGLSGYPSREEPEHDVVETPRTFGIPGRFPAHARQAGVLGDTGLTPVRIAGRIGEAPTAHGTAGERDVPKESGA